MVTRNIAEIVARALEGRAFDIAKTVLCRECQFTWKSKPDRELLAKSEDPRIRAISKYIGRPWVSVRTPHRIVQAPEELYEDLYGMKAAYIFEEPGIILHEDLMEYAGILLPALNGVAFFVAGRDSAGNILIEKVRGRIVRPPSGKIEPYYQAVCEVVDVVPKGWKLDLQELKKSLGCYVDHHLSPNCRNCSASKFSGDLVAAGFSRSF